MKMQALAVLALALLVGCGAQPSLAPMSTMAASRPLSAEAAAPAHLSVKVVYDEPDSASSVVGRDGQGTFTLLLVWTSVPRTYISRLSTVTLNGKPVTASELNALRAELQDAATQQANRRFAKQLADIAVELGEYPAH